MTMWLSNFGLLFFIYCFQQHNVKADHEESKELDILWRKYGDLRSDVEELKSKHRNGYINPGKEKTDTATVKYEDKKSENDEIRFVRIGPKLISATIEKDHDGYWAYKVKMFPVTDVDFQCGVGSSIVQFRQDSETRNKPYPRIIEKEGVLEVTCFQGNNINRQMNGVYLSVMPVDAPAVSVVFNGENGEGTQELEWFNFQYHAFPSKTSNGLCKSIMTLRWNADMNVTKTNMEVGARALFINGSKPTAETFSFNENTSFDMNLTTNFKDRNEVEIASSMPKIDQEREPWQGFIEIYAVYSLFSPIVEIIYLTGMTNNERTCMPKIQKGKFALLSTHEYSLKEGEIGSIYCTAIGNPAPAIIMYIETEDKNKTFLSTQTYRFKDTLSGAVKTWESTPSRIGGKVMCEAESGSKSIRKEIKLKIFSPHWIAERSKVTLNNGNNMTIQLQAKGPSPLHFTCFLNETYGKVVFREKVNNDGSGNEQLNLTNNAQYKQTSFAALEEVNPMITSYETSTKSVNKTNIKTSRFTIDLYKAKGSVPFNLVCSAFETPMDVERDWIEIPWQLH